MSNYRYNTPDYMRRMNSYSRPSSSQTSPCPSVPVTPCCDKKNEYDTLHDLPLAMAYIPWQYFSTPYEPQKALKIGTIFPELDKPFLGRKAGKERR